MSTHFKMQKFYLLIFLIVLFACDKDEADGDLNPSDYPNILFIIADDMGKDATAGYSEGNIKPNTPNLNSIRDAGLMFTNFWAYPICSPTRASIITGKYGYRTDVKWADDPLENYENILQDYINKETANTYSTAIIGKWHLSGNDSSVDPEIYGIDHFAGLMRGTVQDYYQWRLTEGGAGTLQTEYITKVFTDLSIDWINGQDKPWFLWLAYNAPHTPFHVPPSEMHTQGDLPTYDEGLDAMPYYMAAIEAMDFQIGRLIDNIPKDELENTVIIFIGDNGSPNQVAQFPYSDKSVKGSLYQGGVNVPMFISGEGVSRAGEDNSLICSTDIYSTIAELAGVDNSEIYDSKSFKKLLSNVSSHRDFQYAEMDSGNKNMWTISNGEFKLIINANGNEEMYDLSNDPYEKTDLLEGVLTTTQENAKIELEAELLVIRN